MKQLLTILTLLLVGFVFLPAHALAQDSGAPGGACREVTEDVPTACNTGSACDSNNICQSSQGELGQVCNEVTAACTTSGEALICSNGICVKSVQTQEGKGCNIPDGITCSGAVGLVCSGGICIKESSLPKAASRLGLDTDIPTSGDTIIARIQVISNWVFAIFLAISLIYILLAAFQFVTAGGQPDKVSEARQKLIYAAIGIAIALIAAGFPAIIRTIVTN